MIYGELRLKSAFELENFGAGKRIDDLKSNTGRDSAFSDEITRRELNTTGRYNETWVFVTNFELRQ